MQDSAGYPTRDAPELPVIEKQRWVFRHPVAIRITHWINAICIFILLMSGLQIFNAHPYLYWGQISHFESPILAIDATSDDPPKGQVKIFGRSFNTTGVLGVSVSEGESTERGFPAWLTLPGGQDLATGRRWHFLFAWIFVINGLLYVSYLVAAGQFRPRLIPTRDQWKHFGRSILDHAMLRFPKGTEAKRYNILQKLTYAVLIFVLLPIQILAGLTMSPGMNAFAPFLLELFGGRQSARTIHFIIANLIVAFIVVHVVMVLLSGVFNNLRGMVTGWFSIGSKSRTLPSASREKEGASS